MATVWMFREGQYGIACACVHWHWLRREPTFLNFVFGNVLMTECLLKSKIIQRGWDKVTKNNIKTTFFVRSSTQFLRHFALNYPKNSLNQLTGAIPLISNKPAFLKWISWLIKTLYGYLRGNNSLEEKYKGRSCLRNSEGCRKHHTQV